jgi:hypothetical protein
MKIFEVRLFFNLALSDQTVDLFTKVNECSGQEFSNVLKIAAEHKKKVDSIVTDQEERKRKMEALKGLRDSICNNII